MIATQQPGLSAERAELFNRQRKSTQVHGLPIATSTSANRPIIRYWGGRLDGLPRRFR